MEWHAGFQYEDTIVYILPSKHAMMCQNWACISQMHWADTGPILAHHPVFTAEGWSFPVWCMCMPGIEEARMGRRSLDWGWLWLNDCTNYTPSHTCYRDCQCHYWNVSWIMSTHCSPVTQYGVKDLRDCFSTKMMPWPLCDITVMMLIAVIFPKSPENILKFSSL